MQTVEVSTRRLSLSTADAGGHLRLAFVGVGSAFSTSNWQTNLFLIKGEHSLLVDCGALAGRAMASVGLNSFNVKALLPTHSHADHVGGIEELALKWRYVAPIIFGGQKGDHKPTCIITELYEDLLWQQTLRGGLGYSEIIQGPAGPRELAFTDYFDPLRPTTVPGFSRPVFDVDYEGLHLQLMRTKHIPEQPDSWRECLWSVGLVIDGRVFYPGDTRFDRELIDEWVTDSIEAVFHDCQSFPGGVHASFEELKTLPGEVRERMYLLHLDDGMLKLDADAAAGWADAEKAFGELLDDPKADERAFLEAELALSAARRASRDAAEAVVREAGFVGFTRDSSEAVYDFPDS